MKVYKNEKAKKRVLDTYDKLLEMWNVDKEERDIQTTYGMTHVILCGNKSNPPLVLFHGVGDNSALMWIFNAEFLARHFWVIAIDTIGGPGKSIPNENYNKDFDGIIWIDEVLKELGIDEIFIAGTSNGAYLAQYYGVYRPYRIRKIICMAGGVPDSSFSSKKAMVAMMRVFLPEALFPTLNNMNKLIKKLSGKNSMVFTSNIAIMEHYQALLKGFNNMAMRYHNLIGFNDSQIDLIRNKTLYLLGEADPFVEKGGQDIFIQSGLKALFFPDVGHGINHEIADEVNAIFLDFLLPEVKNVE
ncbi:MAG: alpha/beta hydrolase [Lachnospiraceae bacterium]|nr:alpha/beta hydrolase [Lachnospiraceae bacterium]